MSFGRSNSGPYICKTSILTDALSLQAKAHSFVCLFLVLFFPDRMSLCSSGCPGIHFVDKAGVKLRDLLASASQVLGLKARVNTSWLRIHSLSCGPKDFSKGPVTPNITVSYIVVLGT